METVTIRVQRPTDEERALLNILSVEERLQVLVQAAREKARKMAEQ